MNNQKLLCTGCTGTVIAAICCFTPFLVIVLGGVGLSAWLGWLDYVLFPLLFALMGLIAFALYLRSGSKGPSPRAIIVIAVAALSALLYWLQFHYALRISIAAAVIVAAYAFYLREGGRPGPVDEKETIE
jgi:hypothetical protein